VDRHVVYEADDEGKAHFREQREPGDTAKASVTEDDGPKPDFPQNSAKDPQEGVFSSILGAGHLLAVECLGLHRDRTPVGNDRGDEHAHLVVPLGPIDGDEEALAQATAEEAEELSLDGEPIDVRIAKSPVETIESAIEADVGPEGELGGDVQGAGGAGFEDSREEPGESRLLGATKGVENFCEDGVRVKRLHGGLLSCFLKPEKISSRAAIQASARACVGAPLATDRNHSLKSD
jgi:hypothetical protein